MYKFKHKKKPLGIGGFGRVYHCKHLKLGKRRAVKCMNRNAIKDMMEF